MSNISVNTPSPITAEVPVRSLRYARVMDGKIRPYIGSRRVNETVWRHLNLPAAER